MNSTTFNKFIIDNDIKAFLFDLNGTMVDDVGFHIEVWHKLVNEMGLNLSIEEMKKECYGRNEELIERLFPGKYSLEERFEMGAAKEAKYRVDFLPQLKLIEGCENFIAYHYKNGIKMAIGSAAIIPNIDFVLDNCNVRQYFDVIVSGEDVSNSKPDPEVFLKCAELLKLKPKECLVIEDVPKGVEAASRAGMKSVVIMSTHHDNEFEYLKNDIICYVNNYTQL